jgi:hypothetical protein
VPIQSQPGFAVGFIGAVALEAVVGQQGQNITTEADLSRLRAACGETQ